MAPPSLRCNPEWFLDEIERIHHQANRRMAFVLGAGASVQSGITSGAALADHWLDELFKTHRPPGFMDSSEAWCTAENLEIDGFEWNRRAEFYPQIYERRWRHDHDEGAAFLEEQMQGKEPSYGYSVLAQLVAEKHNVVITTNFDNLCADALAIYTQTLPLVCGHESLANFLRPLHRRPIIAKVHRDLLLSPINDPEGTSEMSVVWKRYLKQIFTLYTPVVIGYGGNDGSMMGFLEELSPDQIPGRFYWCYYEPGGDPPERVIKLLEKHRGLLVPVQGFDEVMAQIAARLGIKFDADKIIKAAEVRAEAYRNRVQELVEKTLPKPSEVRTEEKTGVEDAVEKLVASAEGWWGVQVRINATENDDEKERLYREGLKKFPESAELAESFAIFLDRVRKDYEEAERLYRLALKLDTENPINVGNFALFLTNVRKEHGEAEQLYRRALQMDPAQVNIVANFASFLHTIRKDSDEAERLYRRALQLDPEHANNVGNFANFMKDVRKDYDEAERLYRQALKLDYQDARKVGNFAIFLSIVREDHQEAERLYRHAIQLDPNNGNAIGNFASLLLSTDRPEESKEWLEKSWNSLSEPDQLAAELLVYRTIIHLLHHENANKPLGMLKTLLEQGFLRGYWSFGPIYKMAEKRLKPDQVKFLRAIGEAVLDEEKVPKLKKLPQWKAIRPLPLELGKPDALK